jgi:hypothetical protein
MAPSRSTCWPNPLQQLLLRAALLDGDAALRAWAEWRERADLDHIDSKSYGVLPALSANLGRLGMEGSYTALLKGVRRQTWAANHRLVGSAMPSLRRLDGAGIPLLLLDGAALAAGYYRDLGTRALDAVDVLVPRGRIGEAIALLEESGWETRRTLTADYLSLHTSVALRSSDTTAMRLHWHVMRESARHGGDDAFRLASRAVELEGLTVRALAPTDQLLHVLADGIGFEGESKLRWPVDALTILRAEGAEIDWERLIAAAQRLRLALVARDGLVFLRDRLAGPIPTEVIERLSALPTTRGDRMEYRLRTGARGPGFAAAVGRLWFRHCRMSESTGGIHRLLTFPRFLERYYELDSPWRLPAHALGRVLRRIRRSRRRPA